MAQHIHRYRRVNIGKEKDYWVMQCSLPHCNHYVPMTAKNKVPYLIGKIAICNKCNDPFELDRNALTKEKPVCNLCIGGSKQEKLDKAAKFFEAMEKKAASGGDFDQELGR